MGLKRWNGTSWVPTIYQPTLNASEILNDSSVEGGNVKAALEKLAQGGGSGSSNIYIANLELGYSSGSYTVESGPTITELAAAYNANKQIFVKAAIEEDGMVMNFYGECVYAMSGEDIGYQGVYEFILKIEKAYAYDYTMMENLHIVTLNYPSEQTWEVYEEESGGGTWGSITGTLSSQTDLWNALSGKEVTSNKVTSVSSSSTDTQYPSAKCVYNNSELKVPSSGTTGYFLKKSASGANTWAEVQSGGGTWGSITGTLSNQTDLNTALNNKANTSDLTGKENSSNKVTSISSSSTDTQYPSAKCVYTALEAKVPSTGTNGYYLQKTSNGPQWTEIQQGGGTWGSITGDIDDQTDLSEALGSKGTLVTSISSSSTDTQYPSAKCVYDIVGDIETILRSVV